MNEMIMNSIYLVGVLAFLVSVIVEVTKSLPLLRDIPTDLEVFIVSIGLTLGVLFAYVSIEQVAMTWYLVALAVIAGFIVSFIAMYGWEKLSELWDRFKK